MNPFVFFFIPPVILGLSGTLFGLGLVHAIHGPDGMSSHGNAAILFGLAGAIFGFGVSSTISAFGAYWRETAEDAADLAVARAAESDARARGEKPIPWEQVRRELDD